MIRTFTGEAKEIREINGRVKKRRGGGGSLLLAVAHDLQVIPKGIADLASQVRVVAKGAVLKPLVQALVIIQQILANDGAQPEVGLPEFVPAQTFQLCKLLLGEVMRKPHETLGQGGWFRRAHNVMVKVR